MERLTYSPDVARAVRETGMEVLGSTLRYLGREYRVGDFIRMGNGEVYQIAKIELGVGYLRLPEPQRTVPKQGPKNRPWYQQHDKRKWK